MSTSNSSLIITIKQKAKYELHMAFIILHFILTILLLPPQKFNLVAWCSYTVSWKSAS